MVVCDTQITSEKNILVCKEVLCSFLHNWRNCSFSHPFKLKLLLITVLLQVWDPPVTPASCGKFKSIWPYNIAFSQNRTVVGKSSNWSHQQCSTSIFYYITRQLQLQRYKKDLGLSGYVTIGYWPFKWHIKEQVTPRENIRLAPIKHSYSCEFTISGEFFPRKMSSGHATRTKIYA